MKHHKMQQSQNKIVDASEKEPYYQVLDIPLDQLLPDPHQPRKKFDQKALRELTDSIKSQSLQQFPKVNIAYSKDGKTYYYLKTGQRRWMAHKLLGYATMPCVVSKERYNAVYDFKRKLQQAAENDSRLPHTKMEIVLLVKEAVEDAKKNRTLHGGSDYGAIQIAIKTIAEAFGKSYGWAENYHTLGGLISEMLDLLEENEEGERLNWNAALALARTPPQDQMAIYNESKLHLADGGTIAQHTFIVEVTRAMREERGEKMRGRKPAESKARLINLPIILERITLQFLRGKRGEEGDAYVNGLLETMGTIETERLLKELNQSLKWFLDLRTSVEARRKTTLAKLYIVKES